MVTSGAPGANYGHWIQLGIDHAGPPQDLLPEVQDPTFAGRRIIAAVLYMTRDSHHLNSRVNAVYVPSSTWYEQYMTYRTARRGAFTLIRR